MNSVSKFQNLPASEGGTSPLRHPPVRASAQLALTRHREAHQLCPPGQSGLATPLFFLVKPENIGFATCMKNIGLRFTLSNIFHTCSSSNIFRYHPQAIQYCIKIGAFVDLDPTHISKAIRRMGRADNTEKTIRCTTLGGDICRAKPYF